MSIQTAIIISITNVQLHHRVLCAKLSMSYILVCSLFGLHSPSSSRSGLSLIPCDDLLLQLTATISL